MHAASRIVLLAFALSGWAIADVPKKAPLTKYSNLWNNSPFTSKPPPAGPAAVANPLDDYALAGVSPIAGGYRVTLLNKKKPEERIVVEGDETKEGFKILAVTRKPGDPLGTVVRMMSGSLTGTVSFDEKLLTLTPPPAAAPPQQAVPPGLPGGQQQPPQPNGQPQRQPRPRVVPPPAPQNRPQVVQPAQNNQRPDRRGGR